MGAAAAAARTATAPERVECLECLEWGEVLRQVARFTRTPFGCTRALRGEGLPAAASAAECGRLCEETERMMRVLEDGGGRGVGGDAGDDLLDGFRPMQSVLQKARRIADAGAAGVAALGEHADGVTAGGLPAAAHRG